VIDLGSRTRTWEAAGRSPDRYLGINQGRRLMTEHVRVSNRW
jgi:hypothetical protein